MFFRRLTILFLLVIFSACTAQKFYMKAYSGPELRHDEVALLKPYLGTIIKSIDGETKYAIKPMRPGQSNLDIDIALRPGEHQIVIGYELYGVNQYQSSVREQVVRFKASAGRRYLLNVTVEGNSWRPFIEDVTDTPEKWCWFEPECKK